ncbi:MAG: DUF3791 domain-containing protein [Treponema sp.]|nr:DUF3791 domain-containing protein [Treponema sp.]
MTHKERDQNLMIVTAVEGYSQRHNMAPADVLKLFLQHNITGLIRSQYNTLHTQSLDESIFFAEDILKRFSV